MELALILILGLNLVLGEPQGGFELLDDDDDGGCRPDCRVVRCGAPPQNCPNGVGIPPCGCCPVCLDETNGNSCGGPNNEAGQCPNGLSCLDETCRDIRLLPPFVPPPVGQCFVPCDLATRDEVCIPNCAAVSCVIPENCRNGIITPPCSCCPICAPETNENSCGGPNNEAGQCPNGLSCLDEMCQDIRLLPPFVPPPIGQCFVPCDVAVGQQICQPDCSRILCAIPTGCRHGIETLPCNCCPTCAKGPGDSCGGPNNREGNCPAGHVCNDINCNIIPPNGGPFNPVGECGRPCGNPNGCPTDCTNIACALFICPFGSRDNPCDCCPVCLKGPGDSCGGPDNICAEGLQCVGINGQVLPPFGLGTRTGRCVARNAYGGSGADVYPGILVLERKGKPQTNYYT